MPVLPLLSIVFVGIGGADAAKVDHQLGSLLHKDAKVEAQKVPAGALRTLARHGDGAREIVRGLHADGVVGGELVDAHGQITLRMVVYGGDGALKDLVETPLTKRQLGRDDLDALRSNLMPDVFALAKAGGHKSGGDSGGEQLDEFGLPVDVPVTDTQETDGGGAPLPSKHAAVSRAKQHAATRSEAPASVSDDASSGASDGGDDGDSHDAAPTETADASDSVSADEAMAIGGDSATPGVIDTGATSDDGLRLRAAVGLGLAGRGFTPGLTTVSGYGSSPVGTVRLDASIAPTARLSFALLAERALGMTTGGLTDGNAPTSMSRWQVGASYTLVRGKVQVAPLAGIGERVFAIDSTDPARAPDGRYSYAVLGASLGASLGARVSLQGLAAFEPVLGGAQATEMDYGDATRWALEVGAAVEVRATQHVFVRGAADWQRFAWSWDPAGTRPGGSAVDSYPSGTLSLGANY